MEGTYGFDVRLLGQFSVKPSNKGQIEIIVQVSNRGIELSICPPSSGECEDDGLEYVGSSRRVLLVALGLCQHARPVTLCSIE